MKMQHSIKTRLNIVATWEDKIKKSGKSISEIARKAKVTRATIYYALGGDCLPSFRTINKIEDVLND